MLRYHPSEFTISGPRPTNTAASSRLECLPYDVLEPIFRLACTDGGRTGCFLSLVSKTIRMTSCAARFHSVSVLCGTSAQLVLSLRALDNATAYARADKTPTPLVRHLCISLTPAIEFNLNIKKIDRDVDVVRHRRILRETLSPESLSTLILEEWDEYGRTFRSLCTRVCQDLETLCVLRHCNGRSLDVLPSHTLPAIPDIPCPNGFPCLCELAFTDEQPPFVLLTNGTSAEGSRLPTGPGSVLYPALRRLHMSISCDTEMDFEWWAVNAPHVTWLRINTKIVADMPGPFPLLPRLESVLGVYHLPQFYNSVSCNITPPGNPHAGSKSPEQNVPPGRPFFSELRTLMFMVKPLFVMTDPPAPASVAAYEGFTAELNAILFSFGVPTTVFKPHYHNQDVDVTVAHRQPNHLDEGMRRD